MADPLVLQQQQGNDVAPAPDGYAQITNPLNPLLRSGSRLAHFTDGVYDLSPESHLMRLLKVLLGEAGVGGVQRQMLLVRLQQSAGGTHFFDLDAFYGSIFGARRTLGEHLDSDPASQLIPQSQWDVTRLNDARFRSRASRMASAIHRGATAQGIKAVAEALTGIDFDVTESWMSSATKVHSWDYWESFTWDQMEAYTWEQLEGSPAASTEAPRNIVTLFPHAAMSYGERFDLERALDRIKPVHVVVVVSEAIPEIVVDDVAFTPTASSEKWEIRQLVQNTRVNGALPYPNAAEDSFVEPDGPAWGGYTGEAWTVLDRSPRSLAYSSPGAISRSVRRDPLAVDMPPQSLLVATGASQAVALPEYALKPAQGIQAGRSVSDGIIAANPYSHRTGDHSTMLVDGVDSAFVAGQMLSTVRTPTRFWTSPIRMPDDPTSEVIEFLFDEPVTVNHISFEYARFPCTIVVEVWDRESGTWINVGGTGNMDASPYGIPNTPPVGADHSHHFGSDHWRKTSLSFGAIVSQAWRIVSTRRVGVGPVGINGTPVPYPLGIRDTDIGYRVNSLSDVPGSVPPGAAIGSSKNLLGLQTSYRLERSRAALVADSLPTAWVCEPQPIRDAVVSLILKVKSSVGAIINRIFVDPTHVGPAVNIYYTSKVQRALLGDPRDDVVAVQRSVGNVAAVGDGQQRGLTLGSGSPAWVDIDMRQVDHQAGAKWMGREYVVTTDMRNFGSFYVNETQLGAVAVDGEVVYLSHGIDTEYVTAMYFVKVVLNGRMERVFFPTEETPHVGSTLRIIVAIGDGEILRVSARVDEGFPWSTAEQPPGAPYTDSNRTYITSGSWDSTYEVRPPDIYETQAYALELNALPRGRRSDDGIWYNSGSAGRSLYLSSSDSWFTGTSADPEWLTWPVFSGDAGHSITTPHAADLSITLRFAMWAQVQPRSWRPSAEQWIISKMTTNLTTGYGLGVSPEGCLVLHVGDGTAKTYTSTVAVPASQTEPLYVGICYNGNNGTNSVATFFTSTDGTNWSALGGSVLGATGGPSANTDVLRIGARSTTVGAFSGAIRRAAIVDASSVVPTSDTPMFRFDQAAMHTDSNWTVTDTAGAHAITVVDGGTGVPPMALAGSAVVISPVTEGMEANDSTLCDLPESFNFAGYAELTIDRLPTGFNRKPLLTKKGGYSQSYPGWGVYINSSGAITLVVSDGVTQWESPIQASPPTISARRRPIAFAFAFTPDPIGDQPTITLSARMRNSTVQPTGGDVTRLSISNWSTPEPVRVFADGQGSYGGAIHRVGVGTTGTAATSGYGFEDMANTLVFERTYVLGSNWVARSDGLISDSALLYPNSVDHLSVAAGDVLFANQFETYRDQQVFSAVPAMAQRFGSSRLYDCGARLTAAVDGYGEGPVPEDFLSSPSTYCVIPASGPPEHMDGEYLRFHPSYIGWTDGVIESIGFVGGISEDWSATEWTPIGQFVLSRGAIDFDDVAAAAIKLEFSNLVAEPYDSFVPVNRNVSRFVGQAIEVQGRSVASSEQATASVLAQNRYPDGLRSAIYTGDPLTNFVSPTAGITVIDETVRDQLSQQYGTDYSFAQWQPSYRAPIQQAVGTHSYITSQVQAVSRTAFFVGLRTVTLGRRSVRMISDESVYDDTFFDADGVDVAQTTYEIEPGQLYTPESPSSSLLPVPRVAVSKPYYSRSAVTAVQFSAQQTGPQQLLPDDEFRSPGLVSYAFDDTSQWHITGDAIVFWDQTLGATRVSRDPSVLDAYYAPDTPIVHPPVSPILASGYGRTVTLDFDSFGGLSSPFVLASPKGIVYAGCRVSAASELQGDLFLRIYDSDGLSVLAERSFRPQVSVPMEVVLPYTLGATVSGGGVQFRVEQDGPYKDSWVMHALSAFDASIMWEFSVDDGVTWTPGDIARGLKYGVVDFPTPGAALRWRVTSYRHNSVIDAVRIRPWYLRRMGSAL